MKAGARYAKIVEWSDEDNDEAIELYRAQGKGLPPPTSGRDFANRVQGAA
jgi:hypothetical protein